MFPNVAFFLRRSGDADGSIEGHCPGRDTQLWAVSGGASQPTGRESTVIGLSLCAPAEAAMRHPFYMDHLDPDDQSTVRRWYFGIVVFYSSLALLSLLVGAAMVDVADFHVNTMRRQTSAGTSQTIRLAGASGAFAAEPAGIARCAMRDLALVTAIEAHGEAQDVPADKLGNAFFTVMSARAACAAGRVAEALAIYDSIVIVAAEAAEK
jgi:hypothetical protein